ncbi:hypothetical protein [Deinococcus aerius]|uniref:hypothetical protein n=1 Tax=Deinococcus aerius TaxID=200253 RepID=UPI0013FD7BF1|nr:hypothetical protein [Deinococcus aerius]
MTFLLDILLAELALGIAVALAVSVQAWRLHLQGRREERRRQRLNSSLSRRG